MHRLRVREPGTQRGDASKWRYCIDGRGSWKKVERRAEWERGRGEAARAEAAHNSAAGGSGYAASSAV